MSAIPTFSVTATIQIDIEVIASMITDALDQRCIRNWAEWVRKEAPPEWVYVSDLKHPQGEHWDDEYPLSPGGAIILKELGVEDAPELRFDLKAIQQG